MVSPIVSEDDKIIARTLAFTFAGKPRISTFWDDSRRSSVDVLVCEDRPQEGVASYGTVNLSNSPLIQDGKEYEARLEIVGVCGHAFKGFDNALATAAFCIINSRWFCYPGAIFPDVLAMHNCSLTMQHLLFVPPFLWPNLQTLRLSRKIVAWLLAIPISESERQYANQHGAGELEKLFLREQIDLFNLNRNSVV